MTNTHRIVAQLTTTKKDELGWPWECTTQIPSFNVEAADYSDALNKAGAILGLARVNGGESLVAEITVVDLNMSTLREFTVKSGEITAK